MNIQYAMAVHILSLVNQLPNQISSSEIAVSVGTNPVVIRNVLGMLRRAKLLESKQGVTGSQLARDPAKITLLDVYRAVQGRQSVFRIHENAHPDCPIGATIQKTLEAHFERAQAAMEKELAQISLANVFIHHEGVD